MSAPEIRAEARQKLAGKWKTAVILTLIYAIIEYAISKILSYIPYNIGDLIDIIITVPLAYGFISCMMKLNNNEEVGYLDFFTLGFDNFSKIWSIVFNTFLKMIIPVILIIVCAIILSFGLSTQSILISCIGTIAYIAALVYTVIIGLKYSLVYFIQYDNPEMTGKEIVEKSEELMNGKVGAYFYLSLTFIGWAILACFTLGIGMIWLIPYLYISQICFYKNLTGKIESTVVTTETTNNENEDA